MLLLARFKAVHQADKIGFQCRQRADKEEGAVVWHRPCNVKQHAAQTVFPITQAKEPSPGLLSWQHRGHQGCP